MDRLAVAPSTLKAPCASRHNHRIPAASPTVSIETCGDSEAMPKAEVLYLRRWSPFWLPFSADSYTQDGLDDRRLLVWVPERDGELRGGCQHAASA